MRREMSLSHLHIARLSKLEGKPPSGNDSSSVHHPRSKRTRDGRRVCIPSGSDFKFLHIEITISDKFRALSPPLGKETKSGHSRISKREREANGGKGKIE